MASAAVDRGHEVGVADLRPALELDGPLWPEMVRLARIAGRHLREPVDVIAHSGAGALLPGIGAAMGPSLGRLVFVDAVLPPASGPHRFQGLLQKVEELAGGADRLPSWWEWWPEDTVARLVPDRSLRKTLQADTPRVPVEWWRQEIPTPTAWAERRHLYVRLSTPYDEDAERARSMGFDVVTLDSHHLAIATDPEGVLDAVLA